MWGAFVYKLTASKYHRTILEIINKKDTLSYISEKPRRLPKFPWATIHFIWFWIR